MHKTWTPPMRWVFLAATLLGVFSTAQSYRLTMLNLRAPEDIPVGSLLILNGVYWYVPAAFALPIFYLARRFRLDARGWPRALAIHLSAAFLFSLVHLGAMLVTRLALWQNAGKPPAVPWTLFAQNNYLMQLDWLLMTYSLIIGLSYAFDYRSQSEQRRLKAAKLETSLVEARLKTLEAELHPHFLFNTLHAISSLVFSNPDAADRMISRLSDLLRITFERSGAAAVSLQEELAFLEKYLEIEQIRFQDRLTVRYDIEPETLDAEVPRLILQPLVENAIKHGVAPRSEPGIIEITARRQGGALAIAVRDNGVGLSAPARARFSRGIGLSNTRARLDCLYGDAHTLEFSEGHGGLVVTMQIPFNAAHPAPAPVPAATQVA